MRRYLLLVFLFVTTQAFAAKEPIPVKTVNCSHILAKAYKTFSRGDDTNAAAYIGLSHENLLELLNTGHISGDHFVDPPMPRLTKEHPFAAKIIKAKSAWPNEPWSREDAIGRATSEATRQTQFKIISNRISELTLQPLSPDAQKMLASFLYELYGTEKKNLLTPHWVELRHAFGELSTGPDEATMIDRAIDAKLGRPSDDRDDYDKLRIDQKMLRFLKAVGIHDNDIEVENGGAATKLLHFFSALPVRAGYVIGLKPSESMDQNPDRRSNIENLSIDDIVSIEPLGNDEFAYLAGLEPKAKPRKSDQTK